MPARGKPQQQGEVSRPQGASNPFRCLPSVDEALRSEGIVPLSTRVSRERLYAFVAEEVADWRERIQEESLDAPRVLELLNGGALERGVEARVQREEKRGLVPAINATGVVLHTGLGRAPLHPDVARRMRAAASGYCVLEVDRFSGQRNRRDQRLGELLTRATGAEDGIVVNNNAAAVLLCLSALAHEREVVVSRGELVEIGGSFRVPDVMKSAGVRLVEVGTTNRTRISDYERALGPQTGLLMKVHRSNFKLVGFIEEVTPGELAALGHARSVATAFDLGSGLLEAPGARPLDVLEGETVVRDAVESGVDLVTFSGDKLLGGPQAGLIVGRKPSVETLRAHPVYRALRCDKVTLVGLEATLELLLSGRGDELPTRAMMLAGTAELAQRAERLAGDLNGLPALQASVETGQSEPGSGSAPGVLLPTTLVRLHHQSWSAESLAERLRHADPPVFARIHEQALLLDPRTLLDGDHERLLAAVESALQSNP